MKCSRTLVRTKNRRLDIDVNLRKGFGIGIDLHTNSNTTGPWWVFSLVLGPVLVVIDSISLLV